MADGSPITWLGGLDGSSASWNHVRGCTKVSRGCELCYAMRVARRMDHPGGAYEGLTRIIAGRSQWSGKVALVPDLMGQPLRWARPRMIFVNSMSDLFHPDVPVDFIRETFAVMAAARQHIFLVLTKRPERMEEIVGGLYTGAMESAIGMLARPRRKAAAAGFADGLPNVWLGVSGEDHETCTERLPYLERTPAAVRWLSLEPQIAPARLHGWLGWLDWVVVGGESGPPDLVRGFDLTWIMHAREVCESWRVPLFVKQLGRRPHVAGKRMQLEDAKGEDWAEWPQRCRVREYPRALEACARDCLAWAQSLGWRP